VAEKTAANTTKKGKNGENLLKIVSPCLSTNETCSPIRPSVYSPVLTSIQSSIHPGEQQRVETKMEMLSDNFAMMGGAEDEIHDTAMRLEDRPTNESADDPLKKQIKWAEKMIVGSFKNDVIVDKDAQVDLDEYLDEVDQVALDEDLNENAQVIVLDKPIQVVLDEDIRLALDDEITPALAKGRVKPLLHAVFLPKFLNNHLSSKIVTVGDVDEERTLRFRLYAENLNEAVDAVSGRGACFIIDDGVDKSWEFDYKQANFAAELVNTDAEMLGEGIECTKLTSIPIKINSKDNKPSELLTRPESRGVVADIFRRFAEEADDGGAIAAITGSPGIGKSWTLFYALQQALLYDGATVLFFFQKQDDAVMYLRRKNKIYAWKSKSKSRADSILFKRLDVLVLLDPRGADKGGADFTLGRMKLLYAASNNKVHISSAAVKENGGMQAFLGPPLDSEIYVIIAHLDPHLEQDVFTERKENVGNLIRYILSDIKYKEQLATINAKMKECAGDSKKLELALRANGMSDSKNTIPGTLFQVLPTRPDELTTIAYDGQNVKYCKRVVQAINDNVRKAILQFNLTGESQQ
jgi:hypothetical protein